MQTNRLLSLSSLFISIGIERFGYYGMRAVIVMYFIFELRLPDDQAYEYYALLGTLIYLMAIPTGLLSDLVTGQKWGVIIGCVTAAVGMFVIPVAGVPTFFVGMVLVCIGTNFVRCNLWVLLGRHYFKWDNRRDASFTIGYLFTNLGAFLAPLAIGNFAEEFGWTWGFVLAGLAMLLCLPAFLIGTMNMELTETNQALDAKKGAITGPQTLDDHLADTSIQTPKQLNVLGGLFLFFLIAGVVTLFWFGFEAMGSKIQYFTTNATPQFPAGGEVHPIIFQAINPILIFIIGPLLAILWYFNRNISPWLKVGAGLLLFVISFPLFFSLDAEQVVGKDAFWRLMGLYGLHTAAEMLLVPIALSLATRLSPVRFSTTLFGVFIMSSMFSHQIGKGFAMVFRYDAQSTVPALTVLAILIGVFGIAFIVLRKPFKKLAGGIG